MEVNGTRERVLDSVLPHEITHTIFATHFGCSLPRWADEGGSTTVEHASEKAKQDANLIRFLKGSKGIAFSTMFRLKEYPHEMLPLYAQGYSLTRFLIMQGGEQGKAEIRELCQRRYAKQQLDQGHQRALRLQEPGGIASRLAGVGEAGESGD